jgi:hypothetical protein
MFVVVTSQDPVLGSPVVERRLAHVRRIPWTGYKSPNSRGVLPLGDFGLAHWSLEELDRIHIEHISKLLQHVDGGRILLTFEHSDIVAIDTCLVGKLLLRQPL